MPRGGFRKGAGRKRSMATAEPSRPKAVAASTPPLETLKPVEKLRARGKGDACSVKELLFVQEYLVDLNASAAYLRAGFKGKPGKVSGLAARLIARDRVAAAIQQALAERSKRVHVDQDRVVAALAHTAFADRRKLFERREAMPMKPDDFYNACRNEEWSLPWEKLQPAEQAAWTVAADQASDARSGGFVLKSPEDIPDDLADALEGVEVVTKSIGDGKVEYLHKFHFAPRTPAQIALGKHLGMFHEKGDPRNPKDRVLDETQDDGSLLVRLKALVAKAESPNAHAE